MHFIAFESTDFLLSNDMQFGFVNGGIYHLTDILASLACFKCNILYEQHQHLFYCKELRRYIKVFHALKHLEMMSQSRKKTSLFLRHAVIVNDQISSTEDVFSSV